MNQFNNKNYFFKSIICVHFLIKLIILIVFNSQLFLKILGFEINAKIYHMIKKYSEVNVIDFEQYILFKV